MMCRCQRGASARAHWGLTAPTSGITPPLIQYLPHVPVSGTVEVFFACKTLIIRLCAFLSCSI
jgi:hypothetical protein